MSTDIVPTGQLLKWEMGRGKEIWHLIWSGGEDNIEKEGRSRDKEHQGYWKSHREAYYFMNLLQNTHIIQACVCAYAHVCACAHTYMGTIGFKKHYTTWFDNALFNSHIISNRSPLPGMGIILWSTGQGNAENFQNRTIWTFVILSLAASWTLRVRPSCRWNYVLKTLDLENSSWNWPRRPSTWELTLIILEGTMWTAKGEKQLIIILSFKGYRL